MSFLVIAEVAQAHDGSLGTAHAYIDAVKRAGADYVKFQCHFAEHESSPEEPWRVKFSLQDETRFDYWRRMEFTPEQWAGLKSHCDEAGIGFLCTPFSGYAIDLLQQLGVPAWKVASGEVLNPDFLRPMIKTGKPIWASTGMSTISEINQMVSLLKGHEYMLFQCTSVYPTPPELVGLNVLGEFRQNFGCPVGLSDHSGNPAAGIAAAALGASAVEVHVTLSKHSFGPDVCASLDLDDLARLVDGVRFVTRANENPVDKDQVARSLESMRSIFSKSLFTARALESGTVLTAQDLIHKKPGTGLAASREGEVLGRRVLVNLEANQMVKESDLEPA